MRILLAASRIVLLILTCIASTTWSYDPRDVSGGKVIEGADDYVAPKSSSQGGTDLFATAYEEDTMEDTPNFLRRKNHISRERKLDIDDPQCTGKITVIEGEVFFVFVNGQRLPLEDFSVYYELFRRVLNDCDPCTKVEIFEIVRQSNLTLEEKPPPTPAPSPAPTTPKVEADTLPPVAAPVPYYYGTKKSKKGKGYTYTAGDGYAMDDGASSGKGGKKSKSKKGYAPPPTPPTAGDQVAFEQAQYSVKSAKKAKKTRVRDRELQEFDIEEEKRRQAAKEQQQEEESKIQQRRLQGYNQNRKQHNVIVQRIRWRLTCRGTDCFGQLVYNRNRRRKLEGYEKEVPIPNDEFAEGMGVDLGQCQDSFIDALVNSGISAFEDLCGMEVVDENPVCKWKGGEVATKES